MRFKRFNESLALWVTFNVGTMGCAYLFTAISLFGFPGALHDTIQATSPLPMVTWLSQNFLQLVLLAVIMKGQQIQASVVEARDKEHQKIVETRDIEQHDAVMETLIDMREIVSVVHQNVTKKK